MQLKREKEKLPICNNRSYNKTNDGNAHYNAKGVKHPLLIYAERNIIVVIRIMSTNHLH